MNRIKSLIAMAVMALSLSAFASAQDAGPQGGKPGEQQGGKGQRRGGPGMMKARHKAQQEVLAQLNLTSAQKTKIAALDKKTQEDIKEVMGDSNGRQERGQEMRQIMKAHHDGMQKILTPDQNKKFRELMMAKMKALREQRGKGGVKKPSQQPPPL